MSTIKIKRSTTPGNVPASLVDGELAINGADEFLFYRRSDGVVRSFGLPAAPIEMLAYAGLQVNGAMEIDQEHSGAAVALANNVGKYIVDQWKFSYNHTANTAVFSGQQSVTGGAAPLGPNLNQALQATATTAFASPNIADFAAFNQPIEGLRTSRLAWGTTLARAITIGFWVNATVTGTAAVSVRNSATNRSYVADFTVAAANTWQWVTVTIPGDVIGTWLNTNGVGLFLGFCFGCGTTFKAASPAVWAAGNFLGTASTTNFFATNGNKVQITGVVVLPGNNMASAAHMGLLLRSTPEELRLCQYYFYPFRGFNFAVYEVATGGTVQTVSIPPMRALPTAKKVGTFSLSNATEGSSNGSAMSNGSFFLFMIVGPATGGGQMVAGSTAGFNFDARL